jgi:excisionase family DNA binding protein
MANEEADKLLTTPEVAARLGVSSRRVLALIKAGRLPSKQFGRDHVVKESDLALVAERKAGRPPKSSGNQENSEQ